jgi:hypothetical protein
MTKTVADLSKKLYRLGAIAALIAGLVFRRNLGAAEIPLIIGQTPPDTIVGWFTLLQSNPLLGLSFLNVFDLVNYALIGIMFLALYVALRQTSKRYMVTATVLGLVGIIVYFVSNQALPLLSLSNQYANATTDAQKATLLTAGQALLSNGYDPNAVYPSIGIYLSLLLLAVAGLIIAAVMLRSKVFGRATVYVGIVACALDLVYLAGLTFVPAAYINLLAASCIATAGFLFMIWHLLIGLKLYKLSSTPKVKGGESGE